MSNLVRVASLSLFAMGCMGVEDVEETKVEQKAGIGCSSFYCGAGGNSPEIDHKGLHELDFLKGRKNREGFSVMLPLEHPNGHAYDLWVEAGRVYTKSINGGPALSFNGTPTTDDDLDYLPIVVKNSNFVGEYQLRFVESGRVPYWAKPYGREHFATTYKLIWTDNLNKDPKREWKNICSNVNVVDANGSQGMNIYHVVVFEKDRIDAPTKTVGTPEDGWVNVGCASHALAKLHLSGHTEAAQTQTQNLAIPDEEKFQTSTDERQAWLKMIVGDYCGNGTPFTVAGQPLEWADNRKWMWYPSDAPNVELEARWTAAGASCLNTPRTLANPTAESAVAFLPYHDVEEAMLDICGGRPPECKSTDASVIDTGEHMFSANPF